MTGFGRAEGGIPGGKISVEIRTLNHRYLESSIRLPQKFASLEGEITKLVAAGLARGKVEVSVRENGRDPAAAAWNGGLAKSYIQLLRREARRLGLKDDLALSDLLNLPDLFQNPKAKAVSGPECRLLRQVVRQAVGRCVAMRSREGGSLKKDLARRLKKITGHVGFIARHRASFEREQKKLFSEPSGFASSERINGDVAEELARARSHLAQMRQLLQAKGPVGRRLDFLVQELGREINTIGSKGQSVSISRTVVDFKSELEKIREQIQNIE